LPDCLSFRNAHQLLWFDGWRVVQAVARGHAVRVAVAGMQAAAVKIQAAERRRQQRDSFLQLRAAAVVMQVISSGSATLLTCLFTCLLACIPAQPVRGFV